MALELRNVTRRIGGETHIANATLTFAADAINVLLGPTLSGKTTLLRLMAGLDRPSSGSIVMDGKDVTGVSVRRRDVAMVYQQFINYPNLTVYENIASPLRVAGRPMPLIQVKIVDAEGKSMPPRQAGEICLFGCTITPGYWNRPEETAQTVREGWLHTGDIGFLDEDGYLYISDRAKDMILRGGENVYCVEIENCIADHPDIEEVAVIGVPDADLGERVKAIVRRRLDSDIDALRVQRHVAAHMAKFKVPEIVEFVDAPLPRNAAGKLLKNELRKSSLPPSQ
jgi:acyl-CoA synthetase (AMP-forming)/AMP-acid ligase II